MLDEAVAAGAVRADRRSGRMIGTLLQSILFNAFLSTIGGVSTRGDDVIAAEELWDLILHGIATGGTDR